MDYRIGKPGSPDFSCGMTSIRCAAKSQPSQQHRLSPLREARRDVGLCASELRSELPGRVPVFVPFRNENFAYLDCNATLPTG
jgi:hypothetical protein